MELWDAYNKDFKKVGVDLVRGEKIPEGYFHLVVGIVVKHIDGSYLILTRDSIKEPWPGYEEIGPGGSAIKGENAKHAALRELEEETGIKVNDLIEISTSIQEQYQSIAVCFLCLFDGNKDSIRLQAGETTSYRWVDKEELIKFINSDKCIPTQKLRLTNFINSKYF